MTDTPLLAPFEAYVGEDTYLFASYAHLDGAAVFPELVNLRDQGYRIWYDEGINPGNEWPEEVAKALAGSEFFLVFVSPNAVNSQNVRNEINYALNNRKPFLAIHLVETELPPGLQLRMGDIQAIMKYRMVDESYGRKLAGALPKSLRSVEVLGEKKMEVRKVEDDPLLEIIKSDNLELLQKYYGYDKNVIKRKIKYVNQYGQDERPESLLHHAARYNAINIGQFLVECGISIDERGHFDSTALCVAIKNRNFIFAELLLKQGAKVDAYVLHNRTIIDWEVAQNCIDTAEFLLKYGANVNQGRSEGTLLHVAARMGYVDMVRLLVKYGASLDSLNGEGKTPLEVSVENDKNGVANLLQQ